MIREAICIAKPLRICDEEPKSSTAVIKELRNDENDHTNGENARHFYGHYENDQDSVHLSLVDHDEVSGVPTTTKLNKGAVQLKRDVQLKADDVVEGMHSCETISVIDQPVAWVVGILL
ncbi:unnamed protein product [Trichobilharzia regenti]|nr:unnamed protein product [Trichobilharzia regenti]